MSNSVPTISVNQGVIKLAGDVNCWTVGGLAEQAKNLDLTTVASIDCSAITSFDSAAIAFFISLIRTINVEQFSLTLVGDSGGLLSLATLYGVDNFFNH